MGLEDIFQGKANADVKREIVLELLDTDKNLDEKTELTKPMRWSCLVVMKDYIGSHKLSTSQCILEQFIRQSHKFLISKDREGRKEYIESLRALGNMEQENLEKSKKNNYGMIN